MEFGPFRFEDVDGVARLSVRDGWVASWSTSVRHLDRPLMSVPEEIAHFLATIDRGFEVRRLG